MKTALSGPIGKGWFEDGIFEIMTVISSTIIGREGIIFDDGLECLEHGNGATV